MSIVVVTAVQLGWYGRKINPPFVPNTSAFEFPSTPLTTTLTRGVSGVPGWPIRVAPVSAGGAPMLFANEPLALGIDDTGGYDSAVPTRTVELWRVVGGETPSAVMMTQLDEAYYPQYQYNTVRYDLLPRVGVDRIALTPGEPASVVAMIESYGWRVVYNGPDGEVFAWTGAPVGPHVVFRSLSIANDMQALSRLSSPTFAYLDQVILDQPGRASSATEPNPDSEAKVLTTARSYNSTTVTVRSSGPGWLVVPDMFDPGWSATVNGRPQAVVRGDFNEEVVAIPGGVDTVHMTYRPTGLKLGIAISALAALVCLGALSLPSSVIQRVSRSKRKRGPRDRILTGAVMPDPDRSTGPPVMTGQDYESRG